MCGIDSCARGGKRMGTVRFSIRFSIVKGKCDCIMVIVILAYRNDMCNKWHSNVVIQDRTLYNICMFSYNRMTDNWIVVWIPNAETAAFVTTSGTYLTFGRKSTHYNETVHLGIFFPELIPLTTPYIPDNSFGCILTVLVFESFWSDKIFFISKSYYIRHPPWNRVRQSEIILHLYHTFR